MGPYPFKVGKHYTKRDIYRICKVPKNKQKGNWNTGYNQYNGCWFIFCNIGTAGRTGHDYENRFVGGDLVWYGKNRSSLQQKSIQSLLSNETTKLIFYREDSRAPFIYAGEGKPKEFKETVPVQITWEITT